MIELHLAVENERVDLGQQVLGLLQHDGVVAVVFQHVLHGPVQLRRHQYFFRGAAGHKRFLRAPRRHTRVAAVGCVINRAS